MFKKKRLTRLGDILVNKGLITRKQLDIAIATQAEYKRLLDPADKTAVVKPIGEILIELGYIDRLQLKRGLNWQLRLRHASIAMALCAPFMMFAPSASASVTRTSPITIEAENYSAQKGVAKEAALDEGGGQQLGDINTGDWVSYDKIEIPTAGVYKITYRVSSYNGGAVISLRNGSDVNLGSVPIPKTGSWSKWVEVEQTVTLQQGAQTLKILAEVGGFNINWLRIENVTPHSEKIEAENYSSMSGVIKEATTDINGGIQLGDINTGDWMLYRGINIPASGSYKITYRVSSYNGGAVIALKNGAGATLGATITVPKTGSWNNWIEVDHIVNLDQGPQDLKILAQIGGINLNWFKIEPVDPSSSVPLPSPNTNTPTSFPLLTQAEAFSSMSGVIREASTDVEGGQQVGDINTNDWMNYTNINIPETEDYKIVYRVSSYNGGALITLKNDAGNNLGSISVPKTGNWNNWVEVSHTVRLQKGIQNLKIFAQVGGFNINWFRIERTSATGTTPPSGGLPQPISVVIQSENYSSMKGVIAETTTDTGGGKNVGAIATGDSMSYENSPVTVPVTGKYKIFYRVASPQGGGSVELSDLKTKAVIDTVPVPKTAGWQKWVTVEREVTLNKGEYQFSMLAKKGGFNINWFKVESIATNAIGQSSSSSSSAAAVSSSKSSSSAPAVSSSSKSSTPSMSSSSWSSSSAGPTHVAGSVAITWTAPDKRENGDPIYIEELGGYEIRYKKVGDSKYTYISINDPWTQNYKFDWLEGDYTFQIAAFDKEGIYSPFVDIQRQ
jgi:hypothetical protein